MKYYNVRDIVQKNVTDFSTVREEPALFKAGGHILAVLPVRYYEHPEFIADLARMIVIYAEIFKKLEWLSLQAMKDQNIVSKMVNQITIFSNKKEYSHFIRKGLPEFIRRWAFTVNHNQTRFVRMSRSKARDVLGQYTVDELLCVFMYLFAFNYDAVKKNNLDLLQKILPTGSTLKAADTTSSGIKKKSLDETLPRFSLKPFNKSDWKLIVDQSMQQ